MPRPRHQPGRQRRRDHLGNISYHPAVGKVFKCDFCGGEPKCARHCPSGAITFVDTDTTDERRQAVGDRLRDLIGEGETK